jgi:YVTN family beta-propeller protein
MKTMKTINPLRLLLLSVIIIISGCSKNNPDPILNGKYENGYFITNEGNYGSANGSISFVDEYNSVTNDVFLSNNSFPLGDVVQSMSIINDNAYIVVNASGKIEVASVDSMKHIVTIDANKPRYIEQVSENKAYVTDWGINGVQVLDLTTNTITSTIACGNGPEGILESNGFAYVCNLGGFGFDNTVSIINTSTDMLEKTLNVGDKPASIVVDVNGAVWVLSGGYTQYDDYWNVVSQTSGSLVKIVNNSIELNLTFPPGNSPSDLIIDDSGNNLYFSDGSFSKAVYSMSIYDTDLPSIPLIDRNFYSLGYNDGYIYGTDAVDYVQQGWSYKYTTSGSLTDSVMVGIIPGGYCFTN